MTDKERLQTIDLVNGTSPEEDVLWALTYLLNLPVEDDEPVIADAYQYELIKRRWGCGYKRQTC